MAFYKDSKCHTKVHSFVIMGRCDDVSMKCIDLKWPVVIGLCVQRRGGLPRWQRNRMWLWRQPLGSVGAGPAQHIPSTALGPIANNTPTCSVEHPPPQVTHTHILTHTRATGGTHTLYVQCCSCFTVVSQPILFQQWLFKTFTFWVIAWSLTWQWWWKYQFHP